MSKKLPFWLWPAHWGLSGLEKKKAEINYTMGDGYDRDMALIDLEVLTNDQKNIMKLETKKKYGKISDYEYELAKAKIEIKNSKDRILEINEIEFKYGNITDYEYELEKINITKSGKDLEIAKVELDYSFGKINKHNYEKTIATLKGEPWVNIVSFDVDDENPSVGDFELDWNDKFIEVLEEQGYLAPKPEQVVQLWFNEVCKNVAIEAFDGVGDFNDRVGEFENKGRKKLPNGKWEIE